MVSKYGLYLSHVINYTRVHSSWVRRNCLLDDYRLSSLMGFVGLISSEPKVVYVFTGNYFFICKLAIAPSLKYSPAISFKVRNTSAESANRADA